MADITKMNEQIAAWDKNLEALTSGSLGDPNSPETLLKYWKMQEQSGYPSASENVKYFERLIEDAKMELNRDQIKNEIQSLIKALKDCGGWVERGNGEGWFNHEILADALTLINSQEQRIKELAEENERLRGFNSAKCEDCAGCTADKCDCANIEADTVRKMRETLLEKLYKVARCQHEDEYNMKSPEVFSLIDKVAKEVLGE